MRDPDLDKLTQVPASTGNCKVRAQMLMGEGEDWTTLGEFWQRKYDGEKLQIVAWIWHGDFGSIRRPVDAYLEGCAAPSRAVLQLRQTGVYG